MNKNKLSIIFITYKRFILLEKSLNELLININYESKETIVSDDGSPEKVQKKIKKLPFDKFILSRKNRGLGANNNAGLKAAEGEYILMVQDDWMLGNFPHLIALFPFLLIVYIHPAAFRAENDRFPGSTPKTIYIFMY